MSERTRRNTTNQPSRRYPQVNTTQTSSVNSNNQQNINRSNYHGNQTEIHSTGNCQNSTTSTTTTTNPSTTTSHSHSQSSSSNEDNISICYSYIVAMFSSFLVVLGIYLALTKFNARYLYLSLVGLSTTAIGACIYCISNIRASKLAKRKQRVNINDFTLNSGNTVCSNPNQLQATNTQNVTTIIHILNNRTLRSPNTTTSDVDALDTQENVPAAISTAEGITSAQQTPPQQTSEIRHAPHILNTTPGNSSSGYQPTNPLSPTRDDSSIIVISDSHQPLPDSLVRAASTQPLPSLDQLPENHSCQLSPGADTSGDFSSSTCLIEERQSKPSEQVGALTQSSTEPSIAHNQNDFNSQIQPNENKAVNHQIAIDNFNIKSQTIETSLPNAADDCIGSPRDDYNQREQQADPPANLIDISCSTNNEHQQPISGTDVTDLINPQSSTNLVPSVLSDQQVVKRKSIDNQQRSAHLRRTLVMGLSGEEELIEINEADLDKMSILPPSYESITTIAPLRGTNQEH